MPKPGPSPKFPPPSLVTPCPFLLPAQACGPTAAITHVSERTMSSEKTFQGWLLSQPRRSGSRSELGPEHLRPSVVPRPSVPLLVPRACLVTVGVHRRCSAACGGGWGWGWTPPSRKMEAWCGFSPWGPKERPSTCFLQPLLLPSFALPTAVVNFSALQILSSEKISPGSLPEGREPP